MKNENLFLEETFLSTCATVLLIYAFIQNNNSFYFMNFQRSSFNVIKNLNFMLIGSLGLILNEFILIILVIINISRLILNRFLCDIFLTHCDIAIYIYIQCFISCSKNLLSMVCGFD